MSRGQNQNQRSPPDDVAIGITERVSSSEFSWSGTLRRRFTDFLVNEIQRDGTVLHLKDFTPVEVTHMKRGQKEVAKEQATTSASGDSNITAASGFETPIEPVVPEAPAVSEDDKAILTELLGSEAAESFLNLYSSSFIPNTLAGRKGPSASSPTINDKALRSKIHQEVRRIFNSALDTTTNNDGAIVATIMPKKGGGRGGGNNGASGGIGRRGDGGGGRSSNFRQIDCPGTGDYLHFNLYKMNRDTMEASAQIAKQLNLKPQMIQYAGTKDRRAVTVQRCSVRRRKPHELDRLNSRLYDICIGDFSYNPEPAHLGMLAGNEFTIALKGCSFPNDAQLSTADKVSRLDLNINAALAHMHENGWINYFGHQRFGTFAIGTHEIGRMILSGDIKAAIDGLLWYDDALANRLDSSTCPIERSIKDEVTRSWACRIFRQTANGEEALRRLPRRYGAETTIIRHLSQHPTDYMGAILHITRGLRTMYLHAYQSYVWNHAASKRWVLYGNKVVAGDLVYDASAQQSKTGGNGTSANQEVELDQDGEEVLNASRDTNIGDEDDDQSLYARLVTPEEAANGTFSIFDVVLPTPGFDTLLPANEIGDFYRSFMKQHGGIDPGNMVRPQREFSLAGRYRRVMTKFLAPPSGFVKACADEMEQLAPTDLDLIKEKLKQKIANETTATTEATTVDMNSSTDTKNEGEPLESKKRPRSSSDLDSSIDKKAKVDESGKAVTPEAEGEKNSIAAVVKFQLAKSAYATVALRELMGVPLAVTEDV
ncbi:multisubstrate pseudouridine synthase 7 [Ceratocystis pirilliformis]|uniref:Multisubstrate pseudouridine synthase 7 n=1 Tax=Ceratocystis pirilliformis TaxID=259994 RepID=A0ABR3ZJL4_9PEZI